MPMTGDYDPTGGDFHAVLEESINLVAEKNLDSARNKRRAFKGLITRLIIDCTKTRTVITQACPDDKPKKWNNTLLQKRCDALLSHKAALLRYYYKWSAYHESVEELLEEEALKDEAKRVMPSLLVIRPASGVMMSLKEPRCCSTCCVKARSRTK